jgi:predicted ATPase
MEPGQLLRAASFSPHDAAYFVSNLPMRILSLELTDVRQLHQKEIPFVPGFNLIVGENGAGKSTALRAIATALGKVANFHSSLHLGDGDIPFDAPESRVRVNFQNENEVASVELTRRFGVTKRTGPKPSVPVIWFGANESLARPFYARKTRKLKRLRGESHERREALRFREEMLFEEEFIEREDGEEKVDFGRSHVIRRLVGEVIRNFSPKFERFAWQFIPYDCSVKFVAADTGKAERHALFARSAEFEIMRRLSSEKIMRRRRGWGQRRSIQFDGRGHPKSGGKRIQPFFEIPDLLEQAAKQSEVRLPLEGITVELKLSPRIVVFGPDGPFSLEQLSDGEKRIFSIVVDVARQLSIAPPGWRNIDQAPGIVLIDEIDCHLHPKWQRMIVKALEDLFPACQFIATTHSPFVIQSVQPNALQSLDDQLIADFTDRGIEEIALNVMHVEDAEVSPRYFEMLNVAKEYYRLLDEAKKSDEPKRAGLKARLKDLTSPYRRNPAFQAFLEMKGMAALGTIE